MTDVKDISHVKRRVDEAVDELEKEIAELEAQNLASSNQNTREVNVAEEIKEETPNTPPTEDLSKEEANFKKRYGDLRRHSQKKEQELQAQLDELRRQVENGPSTIPTSEEEIKKWVETNPKAAAIVKALVGDEVSKNSQDIRVKLENIEKANEEVSRREAKAKIKEAHPDFDTVSEDDDFHDWVEKQRPVVQDAVYDGDADDVIWAISLYKNFTTKTENNKEAASRVKSKSGSPDIRNGNKPKFTESQIDRMSPSDYEKNEEAILASMREGSFVYDISGGAR